AHRLPHCRHERGSGRDSGARAVSSSPIVGLLLAARADDLLQPTEGALGGAILRARIDSNEPELLREARGPFPVVEQGPDEVSPHIHSRRAGESGRQMVCEVARATRVIHDAVLPRFLVEARPAFGDVHRWKGIAVAFAVVAEALG